MEPFGKRFFKGPNFRHHAKRSAKKRAAKTKAGTHEPWQRVKQNKYSQVKEVGVQDKATHRISDISTEKRMKWKPIARDFAAPVLATTAAGGYGTAKVRQKKKYQPVNYQYGQPQQSMVPQAAPFKKSVDGPIVEILKAASRPASVEDRASLAPDLVYRDERFDDIGARRRIFPQFANVTEGVANSSLTSSVPGVVRTVSTKGSRGEVRAESKRGYGPGGIGRHLGIRERSMVKPGVARKGQDNSKYRVVRRSEKERSKERKEAIGTGAKAAVATGGLLALKNKAVNDYLRESYQLGRKHFKQPWLANSRKVAEPTVRRIANNPGKYAALVGGVGAAATGFKALREPDTHKIVFD